MQLIDGKHIALTIQHELALEVQRRVAAGKHRPHLAAVLVGNDGGSVTYVNAKVAACERIGYRSTLIRLEDTVTEAALLEQVQRLNENAEIDGFIVQLPLPKHIDAQKVIEAIDPRKDVDGFHPVNVGRMALNLPCFLPATPYGILQLLERCQIKTTGKHCVVIGRSHIVGSPVSMLLARNAEPGNCTVTLCHSRTQNLAEITRTADIIVAALGIPHFLKADMVKEGAVVIDVGTTRVAAPETKSGFRLHGDVDFVNVAPKCSWITPVPGGVGPMTITGLLQNTLLAAQWK
ncbi:MAG: bifunctional 5,10-methylene-tetrahydrofolate dehydrogenase/5,10-methylene-tetrahydrofolate cyclohydrolase [Bacteroidia bacterium]|jgi:methylenetetrahydrofolate dehydrogenase (NADP+)/methenyltetrahydrofolate cyclohydrolase|nr:bifunctional 5,10-methylene-tetrahydrofolate dehydrogenase/5,10-methylene-tetrahydrofolate cyclohydrolase [Bacteroidia bacterium]